MLTVTPDDPYIRVTEPATTAALHRFNHPVVELDVAAPTPPAAATRLGPVPDDTPNGVYRLKIDTDCGCFYGHVNIQMCPRPSFPGEDRRDEDGPDKIIECCPEPAPAPAP